MINLGFQESTYIAVTKTIPVIDITVSFCANFICDNYLLYLSNGSKRLQHWIFKTMTDTECQWALDQSSNGKIMPRGQSHKWKEVKVFMAIQLLIFEECCISVGSLRNRSGWAEFQGGHHRPLPFVYHPSNLVGMNLGNTMYVTFMSMLHYMAEGILQAWLRSLIISLWPHQEGDIPGWTWATQVSF